MSFFEEVYEICKKIPKGKVATYGQIAFLLGKPRAARQVGWALHACPSHLNVPCHRVINAQGELSKGYAISKEIQKQLLVDEGIQVTDTYTVDLNQYAWNPNNRNQQKK